MKQFFNFIVNHTSTSLPSREGLGVGFNDFSLRMGQKTPPYLLRTLSMPVKVFAVLIALGLSVNVWGESITFTNKDWNPWTNLTSGSSFESTGSARGVANNGVNGSCESPSSFLNITKIEVVASSNTTGGKVTIYIGSTKIGEQSIANSNNATYTYTPSSSMSGKVKIQVTKPSSKTVYVKSITITTAAAANPYTVFFDAGSGTCGTSSLTEASAGAGVTLPTPTISCGDWTFAGWKETSAQTETTTAPTLFAAGSNYKPSANCTLYAVYKKTEASGSGFSKYEKVTSAPSDWSGNYLFSTGSATATGYNTSDHFSSTSLSPGTTEYASYEFTLTKVGTVGYSIREPAGKYVGWNDGGTAFTISNDAPTTSDTKYLWTPNTNGYTSNVSASARKIAYNGSSDLRPYSNPSSGATYLYKRIEGGSTTTYNSNPDCGPSTYTVSFAVNPAGYGTVSQASLANVASGTSISANGAILTVGSTNITATPATETTQYTYTFNNWTWSPAGSTITAATTATANFNRTENSYTVSYSDDGKVDYTNKPTSVKYSDIELTINATPKSGYNITGVSVTMGGSALTLDEDYTWEDGELMIMPTNFTGNIVITFTTELVQTCTHEITITKGTPSHGSFDLSQMGVVCIDDGNATVSVTNIYPNEHYHFKQITATIGSVDNTNKQVTNISANTTINVEFEEDTKYTITFVDAVHGESVAPKSVYENGTFTFPSITDKTAGAPTGDCVADHYHFIGWVEEGTTPIQSPSNVITAGTTSVKITENVTYKAVWAQEEL